jgi:acetyl esterase/lipase
MSPAKSLASLLIATLGTLMLGLVGVAHGEDLELVSEDQYMAFPPVAADHRIPYGSDPMQFGDLYLPRGAKRAPVVVLVHGGCWMARFGLEPLGKFADTLRSHGLAVWSLEYRRVGNGGGWPATYEDVAAGTDFVRELAKRYPLDADRVVIVGHSAGGHLSAWLASRHKIPPGLPFHTSDPLKPVGTVTLAGILDMRAAVEGDLRKGMNDCAQATFAMIGATSKEQPNRYRAASPIELLPIGVPHWILVGEHDNPLRIEQLKRYADIAREQGDDAKFELLAGAGHFEPVDVDGPFWNATLSAIKGAAGMN